MKRINKYVKHETFAGMLETTFKHDVGKMTYTDVCEFYQRHQRYGSPRIEARHMQVPLITHYTPGDKESIEYNVIAQPENYTINPGQERAKLQLQYYSRHVINPNHRQVDYTKGIPDLEEILNWHWMHKSGVESLKRVFDKMTWGMGNISKAYANYYADGYVCEKIAGKTFKTDGMKIKIDETPYNPKDLSDRDLILTVDFRIIVPR